MNAPTRRIGCLRFAIAATSLFILGACTAKSSTTSPALVETWIPAAASRAAAAGLDSLQRADGTSVASEPKPSVALAALIGPPQDTRAGVWIAWIPIHGRTVKQDLLLKASDGRYFSASFIWTDDPILDDCVQMPAQCAKFANQRAMGIDEAKEMLSHSPQGTPALMLKFFGPTPARAAHT